MGDGGKAMAGLLIKGGWSSSAKTIPKETLVHPEFNPSEGC